MLPVTELHAKDGGFLVDDELTIVAEVEVLEVIGKSDVSDKSEEATQPLKRKKLDVRDGVESNHFLMGASSSKETVVVNDFEVLPSQVGLVRRIFGRHPDIALGLRLKNPNLKTSYLNFLLSLIEALCQSPQELSFEDLSEVDKGLAYMRDAGFKVDWLEPKLDKVKENKMKEQIGETRIQLLEKELNDFKKKKCSGIEALLEKEKEALLEKEKAKVFTAKAPLTLDDLLG